VSADAPSPEPTDEEITLWVRERYGDKLAKSINAALTGPASSSFAQGVRRSLIREMTRT
jgi:hypothetical protein